MALYDASRIRKPEYFRLSPYNRGRGKRPAYIIGFDSEAERGKPFLFQFAHPGKCPIHFQDVDLVELDTSKHVGLETFVDYLADHCTRKDVEYIVYGYNLQYEWTQIFHDIPDELKVAGEFDITLKTGKMHTARVRATNDKRYMATIEFGGTKRRVKLADAMSGWFGAGHVSLDRASRIIGIGQKMPKPKEFSRKAARTPEFIAYAKQDAILTQKLGEYIIDLHETYDVPLCISAPHFAARVFRRQFLQEEIPLAEGDLEQLGLDTYHGGKNGYYLPKPMMLRDIWHYDIRSAYPEAMSQLPDVEKARWLAHDSYVAKSHSIWRATITYQPCEYGSLQCPSGHFDRSLQRSGCDDRCKMPLRSAVAAAGRFDNPAASYRVQIQATGYEIDAAIARGEITLHDASGWVLTGPSGGPLARYCHTFYEQKRTAKNETQKAGAKLHLNSLYGKFFQKVPLGNVTGFDLETMEMVTTDPEQDFDYEAGGLYHPPIAALITGYVRAKIHELEHRYRAVMTSTDGFFAYEPPDESMIGDDLGMLSAEKGNLKIWRERLYVFWPHRERGSKRVRPTYALHGFRGKPAQLRHVPLTAGLRFEYAAQAMITLKMSTRAYGKGTDRRKYEPGTFVALPFDILLPDLPP